MKYKILVIIFMISIKPIFTQDITNMVCIGNKVNIRDKGNLNGKILSQCNIGDIVEILKMPEYTYLSKTPNDYWINIKFNNVNGYIYAQFLSDQYFINDKYLIYRKLIKNDGATNPYDIIVYSFKDKKIIKTINFEFTEMKFSNDGQYFYLDAGGDFVRSITFFRTLSLEQLYQYTYLGNGNSKWINNQYYFNKFKSEKGDDYLFEETIFENGKIKTTGKLVKYKSQM